MLTKIIIFQTPASNSWNANLYFVCNHHPSVWCCVVQDPNYRKLKILFLRDVTMTLVECQLTTTHWLHKNLKEVLAIFDCFGYFDYVLFDLAVFCLAFIFFFFFCFGRELLFWALTDKRDHNISINIRILASSFYVNVTL